MQQLRRTIIVALAALLLASSVFVVLAPSIAKADGKDGSVMHKTLQGEILDHQLYYFLVGCFGGNRIDKIPNSELAKWEWFKPGLTGDSVKPAIRGDMYDKSRVFCGEGWAIREAFGRFGFIDPYEAFCSMSIAYHDDTGGLGKTVNGGDTKVACTNGKGGGNFRTVDNEIFGDFQTKQDQSREIDKVLQAAGTTYTTAKAKLTPEKEYLRNYLTFMKGCGITLAQKYKAGDASDDPQAYRVAVVNSDGSVEYWLGQAKDGVRGRDSAIKSVRTLSSPGEAYEKGIPVYSLTCGELAMSLRPTSEGGKGLAAAYATLIGESEDEELDVTPPGTDEGDTTNCAIDGIGWIICPIFSFVAGVVDDTYKFVEGQLLVRTVSDDRDSGLYQAWSIMRNIANVAFIIAFLIIIYSQLTSVGVSNYGIKKLLPKLIIAAILVNASFWVTAIAVDLSNIIGMSLKGLMDSMAEMVEMPDHLSDWETGEGWIGVTGRVLVLGTVGVAGYAAIGFLVVVLPAMLFAIITAFLVLLMRQVLIVLLIVVAPLAFVALLLPNTEEWFKKWRGIFVTMLVMFPAIALVFGASALASKIIMASAVNEEDGEGIMMIQLMGAAVAIVPLFITPIIMKVSGTVLNRFGDMVNKAAKPLREMADKRAQATADAIGHRKDINALNANSRWGRRVGAMRRAGIRRDLRHEALKEQAEGTKKEFKYSDQRIRPNIDRAASAAVGAQAAEHQFKADHVNQNHDLYHALHGSEDAKELAEKKSKNLYQQTQVGENYAQKLKEASKEGENIAQKAQKRYLESAEGELLEAKAKKLKDEVETLDAEHESEYLRNPNNMARRAAMHQAKKLSSGKDQLAAQAGEQLNLTPGSEGFTDQAKILVGDTEIAGQKEKVKEFAFDGSNPTVNPIGAAGAAALAAKTEAEGITEQVMKIATDQGKEQLGTNARYIQLSKQAATAAQGAARAASVVTEAVNRDQGVIDATAAAQGAEKLANAAESDMKRQVQEEIVDQNMAARAAADALAAAEADEKNLQDELATERGLEKVQQEYADLNNLGIRRTPEEQARYEALDSLFSDSQGEYNHLAGLTTRTPEEQARYEALDRVGGNSNIADLQAASVSKRAQAQRAAVAGEVAVDEYAQQVIASPELAATAGGINKYGASRAVAAAEHAVDEGLMKRIGDEAGTFASTPTDVLQKIWQNGEEDGKPVSLERRAAAAQVAASRGDAGKKMELLDDLGAVMESATNAFTAPRGLSIDDFDNWSDDDKKAYSKDDEIGAAKAMQKMAIANMKEVPAGIGDRTRELMALGRWRGNLTGGIAADIAADAVAAQAGVPSKGRQSFTKKERKVIEKSDHFKRITEKLKPEYFATCKPEDIAVDAKMWGVMSKGQQKQYESHAQAALSNPMLSPKIKDNITEALKKFANLTPPAATTAPPPPPPPGTTHNSPFSPPSL